MKLLICLFALAYLSGCVQSGYSPSYITDAVQEVATSQTESTAKEL